MRQLGCRFIWGMAVAGLLLAGCSRATAENYEKIQVGMKKDEIHHIIGKPNKVEGGGIGPVDFSVETWTNDPVVITLTFEGDTLAMKSITGDRKE